MSDNRRDEVDYAVYCINSFARRNGLPYGQTLDYLSRYGGLDFLVDFYDVNSTIPLDLTLEDMRECCRRHGGALV